MHHLCSRNPVNASAQPGTLVNSRDQAMRHPLRLGHRRIAASTGPPGWLATEDRRAAYHAALAAAGIRPEPAFEVASDFQVGPAVQAAATLLDLPEPPTAIFAFNDSIAWTPRTHSRYFESGELVPFAGAEPAPSSGCP